MPLHRLADRLTGRARRFARSLLPPTGIKLRDVPARPSRWSSLANGPRLRGRTRQHLSIAFLALLCAVTAFGFAPLDVPDPSVPVRRLEVELPSPSIHAGTELASGSFVSEETVRRGDTLGTLLTRLKVNDPAAEAFVRANVAARPFYQLRAGRPVEAVTAADGTLEALRYVHEEDDAPGAAALSSLVLERVDGRFAVRDEPLTLERHLAIRSAEITTSLFAATDAAGIPDAVAAQIPEILAGDIDFYRDLRRGDHVRVIYESFADHGREVRPGRVLALEFIASGKVHDAVWYQPDGAPGTYFGLDGASLRRAFLRTPLQFTRISSGFGGRLHPILNIWKWHTGIDYAAPLGTPVRATGAGVVAFAGRQNGYGNVIILKHAGGVETVYGHLSAFASGLRAGKAVLQGQLIGQVGMTGWATGPHLHYEFRVAGQAKDPLRATLPDAPPLKREELAAFVERTQEVEHDLALLRAIDANAPPTVTPARGA